MEAGGQGLAVDHDALGGSGVDVIASHMHDSRGGVEVFILQLAELTAIHGVGPLGAEAIQRKTVGAATDLFIRREPQVNITMRYFWMGQQMGRRRDDFADPGLVIGTEQGGAIGGDEILSQILAQRGEFDRAEHLLTAAQGNLAALVRLDELGLYRLAGEIRCRVHVGDEADGGNRGADIGRQQGGQIAVVIQCHLVQTQSAQLVGQQAGEGELTGRGGTLTLARIGLAIKGDITKEARQ